jgi:protein SCO1/2
MTRSEAIADGILRFFSGGRFPAFALSFVAFYELLMLAVLVAPAGPSGLGAFAEDFRIWCFGYDPATGHMNPSNALSFLLPPAVLAIGLALLWREPLRAALARPLAMAFDVGAAALLVGVAASGFVLLGATPARGELPFPAESLRMAIRPPELRLTDQAGEAIDLAALRGEVVLLTAVYASCPHTCPIILEQARSALDTLSPEERAHVHVVGVTLDPGHDTPEVLAELAAMHGLERPTYHLVTGPTAEVERVLDRMDVSRRRDPETGVIDHANVFLVVDPAGRVAYRLTIGERQQRWLVSALRVLVREVPDAG